MKQRILIIDDDQSIGNLLEEVLTREGYETVRAYSGTEALFAFSSRKPDLVLLDLMLPGLQGEEVLPQLKEVPVIVISARADVDDKVQLLLGGAVDYMTKPFDTKELLARIAVQMRKACSGNAQTLTFGTLRLDPASHMAAICGRSVRLTRTEYAILKLLMENPSQVIAKSVILDRISRDTPDCTESSLKVHISHLRKKLKSAGGQDYIEAVWGIGFKMKED